MFVVVASAGSAFVDPPPTDGQLARAYQNYYTHQAPTTDTSSTPRGVVQWLSRGYRDRRFGARSSRSTLPAALLSEALVPLKQRVDLRHRYLPRARPDSTLLDVGCGSGSFLHLAASLGWRVKGVDNDPKAVEAARSTGLDVTTDTLADLLQRPERFDAVTLSQVIEHLPDPQGVMTEVFSLLKPGGALFISTPNIDSRGHRHFREHWRGLEVPRHLVLFTRRSLRRLLERVGFGELTFLRKPRGRHRVVHQELASLAREEPVRDRGRVAPAADASGSPRPCSMPAKARTCS